MRQTTIFEFMGTPCDFVQQIYDFNKQAGLLEKGYDDFLESSFQIEEALEGFEWLESLAIELTDEDDDLVEATPKELSRKIVHIAQNGYHVDDSDKIPVPDVDRLDKACDAVVFAIGSMAKLGLTPAQITEAMHIVTEANLQKLSMPKDEHGKLTKPANFVGPETKLQAILDKRI